MTEQLSLTEQIRLPDELKLLAEQQLQLASPTASSETDKLTPPGKDPIVGLFGGLPDLSAKAKDILAEEITSASGFIWKKL
ncbi:MAG: hypothetical protein AAFP03_02470 [Cyanobacteria bacterium J06598_3]